MMHDSALDADIMNVITICSRAAWSTSAPPRIAPVIIPGMEMMPITLRFKEKSDKQAGSGSERDALVIYLIWLMAGVRPRRRDSIASGR